MLVAAGYINSPSHQEATRHFYAIQFTV